MDNLIVFWSDILSDCLINEINNHEQRVFETCQSNNCVNNYFDFRMALRTHSEIFQMSVKDKINEYQRKLKQELDKCYEKNKPLVSEICNDSQENNLIEENLKLKEELKQKNDELEKAYCIMEIMRLSSLELPTNV